MPNTLGSLCNIRFSLWLAMSILSTGVIAWIGAGLQLAERSPLGLFSIGVGLAVGTSAICTARLLKLPPTPWMAVTVAAFAVGTVATEHGLIYRAFYQRYVQAWEEQRNTAPMLEIFRPDEKPDDFSAFVAGRVGGTGKHGADSFRQRWPIWLLDLVLVVLSAMIVVWASQPKA